MTHQGNWENYEWLLQYIFYPFSVWHQTLTLWNYLFLNENKDKTLHVGLQQGCLLSPVPFKDFMDFQAQARAEGRLVRVPVDDVVLLCGSTGSLCSELQHALGRYAAGKPSPSSARPQFWSRKRLLVPISSEEISGVRWKSSSTLVSCLLMRKEWNEDQWTDQCGCCYIADAAMPCLVKAESKQTLDQ